MSLREEETHKNNDKSREEIKNSAIEHMQELERVRMLNEKSAEESPAMVWNKRRNKWKTPSGLPKVLSIIRQLQ